MEGEGVRNCVCACFEGPGGWRSALDGEGDGGSGIDAGGGGGGFLLNSPNTIVCGRYGKRRKESRCKQAADTHTPTIACPWEDRDAPPTRIVTHIPSQECHAHGRPGRRAGASRSTLPSLHTYPTPTHLLMLYIGYLIIGTSLCNLLDKTGTQSCHLLVNIRSTIRSEVRSSQDYRLRCRACQTEPRTPISLSGRLLPNLSAALISGRPNGDRFLRTLLLLK